MKSRITKIFFYLTIILPFCSFAQVTKIMGKVVDAKTKQPLPFVSIAFKGTSIGINTDFKGEYAIESKIVRDSLTASYMGYRTASKKVIKNRFQKIDFELEENTYKLTEVVVEYKGNPAEKILKKIQNNREFNNREEAYENYQYEVYNKIEFDANNINEKFKNNKLLKPFKFVFENIDTSTVNGKAYLPLFLIESLSDYYYKKSPQDQKEVIKATKVSGVENESVSQFLGDMYQKVNIYNNYVTLFGKNFVSPVGIFGTLYYKYYLLDSTYIGNKWCYNIMYKPRRVQELTFTGSFWVHDTTFAIKEIYLKMAEDANINFVNGLVAHQEFERVDNKNWMLVKDKMEIDFNVFDNSKKTLGFYGKKTTSYRDFKINKPQNEEVYKSTTNVIVQDSSFNRDESFWKNARHDSLSKNEKGIYLMVDSVKKLPVFRTYVDIIRIITTGYKVWGNFEFGPYFTLYSKNTIEGHRFRFGGRTSNTFSTKYMYSAHLAYGTTDKKFKYGVGFLQMLNKNPRRAYGFKYKSDVEQLGESQNAFQEDNIISSFFRRNPNNKLTLVEEFKGTYEHEWFTGFSNKFNFIRRNIFPLGGSKFEFNHGWEKKSKSYITTSEINIETRFAFKETFVMGKFERTSLGTKYPIMKLEYGYGINNFLKSDYEFHKFIFSISHWFNVASFGYSKYIIEAGRIFGTLPYPLLKLHEGNETYSFDEYAFNMMNYYEFVSDKYISIYYTHHFGGLFFDKFPLLRKLKLREVVYVKGVKGDLDYKNRDYSAFPTTLSILRKPYFEAGAGVENILKIIRIDALWRLSYLNNPDIPKFGVRLTLQVAF